MSDKQVQKRETKRLIVPPPMHARRPRSRRSQCHQVEDKIKAVGWTNIQEILTKSRKVENMLHQGR